jgi:hypothetical protein
MPENIGPVAIALCLDIVDINFGPVEDIIVSDMIEMEMRIQDQVDGRSAIDFGKVFAAAPGIDYDLDIIFDEEAVAEGKAATVPAGNDLNLAKALKLHSGCHLKKWIGNDLIY